MKFILVILAFSGLAFGLPQKQKPGSRIIGGEVTDIKEAGFTLSLQDVRGHFCGAALVGGRVGVTTAKCLKGKDLKYLKVRVGSTDIWEGGVLVDVDTFVIHPKYNEKTNENDIAVFRTKKNLLEVSDVTTILELGNYELDTQAEVTIYGWGAADRNKPTVPSHKLKALQTWVLEQYSCSRHLNRPIPKTSMMCTWSGDNGICQGDEGSPLVNLDDFKLMGLASFHTKECGPMQLIPDVYTNINPLRKWIQPYIKKWDS